MTKPTPPAKTGLTGEPLRQPAPRLRKQFYIGQAVTYRRRNFMVQDAPDTGRIAIYNGQCGTLRVHRSQVTP